MLKKLLSSCTAAVSGITLKKAIRALTSRDWLSFWEADRITDSLPLWIGFLLVILAVVGVGYIGTKRVTYANQFYNVTFTINFLEDIRPGTKIRFQGALIVGEVDYIESSFDKHYIHSRIKKSFFVPKLGSSVTIQTWGYFGAKFINISIIDSFREYEAYGPGDQIKIEPITNSTIAMSNFKKMISREGATELSPLEARLNGVKEMTSKLKKNKFAQPRFMRRLIKGVSLEAGKYFKTIGSAGNTGFSAINEFNETARRSVNKVRKQLKTLKTQVSSVQKKLQYKPVNKDAAFWHEETGYQETLDTIIYLRNQLASFKNDPSQIIFGEN